VRGFDETVKVGFTPIFKKAVALLPFYVCINCHCLLENLVGRYFEGINDPQFISLLL
jgi:hypothetical protein